MFAWFRFVSFSFEDDGTPKETCYMCGNGGKLRHCLNCSKDHWTCSKCSCEDWEEYLKAEAEENEDDEEENNEDFNKT